MTTSSDEARRFSRLIAVLRIAVGGVFLIAGVGKLFTGALSGAQTIWTDIASAHPILSSALIMIELMVGVGLITGVFPAVFGCAALLLLSGFIGIQARELTRADPRQCGCVGAITPMAGQLSARASLGAALLHNGACAVGCAAVIVCAKKRVRLPSITDARDPELSRSLQTAAQACSHRGGWTIIEMLVCVGIIAVLLGLVLPISHLVREHARRTKCASNLSQIYSALSMYAAESRGVIPRSGAYHTDPPPHYPMWIVIVANKLSSAKSWNWPDLPKMQSLQCPSHPLKDIPSAYMMNNFAFDSQPHWTGSPPVSLGKVRNSASVPWLVDVADRIGPTRHPAYDGLFFETEHTLFAPGHLWRAGWRRHHRQTNVLFFDGHVSGQRRSDLPLERFDEHPRSLVIKMQPARGTLLAIPGAHRLNLPQLTARRRTVRRLVKALFDTFGARVIIACGGKAMPDVTTPRPSRSS